MRAAERRHGETTRLRWIAVLGSLGCIATARAGVDFQPIVSVGVSQTDNLTLAPVNPEAQTVYTLIPAFIFKQSGRRMKSDIDYRAEGYYYADRHDSNVYQDYSAAFQTAIDPDKFMFDFGASREQTLRDPESPIARTNLPITTNRIDRSDYYAGPEFLYHYGADGTVRGSYRRTWTEYAPGETGALLVDQYTTDHADVSVDNYRKQRGFTWAFDYYSDQTDYGQLFPTWEYRHAAVQLGTWLSRSTRIFASAGKESPWDDPFNPSLTDDFHEVGLATNAGKDFRVELAAGERSFGSSRRASLAYTFPHGQTQISYYEQPATQGRTPEDFLTRPGAAERFILKRFDWTLGLKLRRTDIALSVYDENREQRTSINGTPLDNQAQSGGSFLATWHLGARTSTYLGAQKIFQQFATTAEQDLRSVWIGANRSLGASTTLALTFTREKSVNNGSENYDADLISLLLTRKF
jgi:hypothetical protein